MTTRSKTIPKSSQNKLSLICMGAGLCLSPLLHAQNFDGIFTNKDPKPYSNLASQFTVSDLEIDNIINHSWDGATMYCVDYDGHSLAQKDGWTGSGHFSGTLVNFADIQTWNRHTGDNQNVAIASSQILYAIDHYYQKVLDSGSALDNRAFALTLWELAYDGGGTTQGINLETGNFHKSLDPNEANHDPRAKAVTWLNEIKNANVAANYTSKSNFLIINDTDNSYQDYILISQHNVGQVPEPSTSLLLSFIGIFGLFRRNRK